MKPEIVQSTSYYNRKYPASSVLILGQDGKFSNGIYNWWAAEQGKITGQGFTMKVGNCTRGISGFEIKNTVHSDWQTRGFRVSGSLNESGPWQPLVEDELDGSNNLVNFTFDKPVGLQFLKFEVLSYSRYGGGLQYFAPISTIPGKETSEYETLSTKTSSSAPAPTPLPSPMETG